jgi:hypothetical protein
VTGQLSVRFALNTATLSADGLYRYNLARAWSAMGESVCWVMLNPSTADADKDDPTIRKCVGFSKAWGYSSLVVVNLFAWRSTDPKGLLKAADPVGPLNDDYIVGAAQGSAAVVCAWGAHARGPLAPRARRVHELLLATKTRGTIFHLGLTKEGAPGHPLMLAYSTSRTPWE